MAKKEEVKEHKSGAEAVSVYDKNGNLVRTFSVAEHGDGFVKMAEGFASAEKNKRFGYVVKKSR